MRGAAAAAMLGLSGEGAAGPRGAVGRAAGGVLRGRDVGPSRHPCPGKLRGEGCRLPPEPLPHAGARCRTQLGAPARAAGAVAVGIRLKAQGGHRGGECGGPCTAGFEAWQLPTGPHEAEVGRRETMWHLQICLTQGIAGL